MYLKKFSMVLIVAGFWLSIFSVGFAQSDEESQNTKAMKRFYKEVVNQGNIGMIDELLADDFVEHVKMPGIPEGKEGVKEFFQMFRNAFPDLKFAVNDLVASGDKVWAYVTITGTHKGPFMHLSASGKLISIHGFDIVRFKDGKAIEHWGLTDSMKMMGQLGAFSKEVEEEK